MVFAAMVIFKAELSDKEILYKYKRHVFSYLNFEVLSVFLQTCEEPSDKLCLCAGTSCKKRPVTAALCLLVQDAWSYICPFL